MNPEATDSQDPFNTKRPEVHRLSGVRRLLFYPAAWGLWLYFRTWRFRLDGASRDILRTTPRPRLVVMWHNRSLVGCHWLTRFMDPSRVACLVSPSRMAAWEVAFFEFIKLKVVRGSSTRRSIQAGIEILRSLRSGDDAGISPDGPSGPLYTFQEGAVAFARKAGASMLLVAVNTRAAWRPGTWDRHLVPLPFARIESEVRCILPDDPIWDKPDTEVAADLRRVYLEMTKDPFNLPNHE